MPIQYKRSYFRGLKSECPYITIYDDEDVEEITQKLLLTDEMAASIGDFKYLPVFPNLKMLAILCGEFYQEGLTKLYCHKGIEGICFEPNYISSKNDTEGIIDLNEFPNLRLLRTSSEYNIVNLPYAKTLQTLGMDTSEKDLSFLSELRNLDTLGIGGNRLCTLSGIENMRLQDVVLNRSKKLADINSLEALKDTLRFLTIDHCPNIKDFSVLRKLKKLESLSICGYKGTLDDLGFINEMPDLKFFVTDYNVLDGNIKPLLRLPYASILQDRRHYNLKDDELRRDYNVKNYNEDIPEWRR